MQNRGRVHHVEAGSAREAIIMLRIQIPKAREFGFEE
jgi:predicted phage tail protein